MKNLIITIGLGLALNSSYAGFDGELVGGRASAPIRNHDKRIKNKAYENFMSTYLGFQLKARRSLHGRRGGVSRPRLSGYLLQRFNTITDDAVAAGTITREEKKVFRARIETKDLLQPGTQRSLSSSLAGMNLGTCRS